MPPLVGLAVNVMVLVAQIVVPLALISTDGVTLGVTVTFSTLDVSFVGEAHVNDDVSTQVMFTELPKFNEFIVRLADVAPDMGTLFRNH